MAVRREAWNPGWVRSLYSDLRGSCRPREMEAPACTDVLQMGEGSGKGLPSETESSKGRGRRLRLPSEWDHRENAKPGCGRSVS